MVLVGLCSVCCVAAGLRGRCCACCVCRSRVRVLLVFALVACGCALRLFSCAFVVYVFAFWFFAFVVSLFESDDLGRVLVRSLWNLCRCLAAAEILKIFCVFASLVRVFALDVFSRFLKS